MADGEIFIYDEIGPAYWGLIDDRQVIDQLNRLGKGTPVTVRINSPGGDVVMAQSIYNALRRHSADGGAVTVEVDALAASAASFLAMAGDTIRIAENAMMMIHKAWTFAIGNADSLRETAGVLDKFDGILADTYAARSGQDRDKIVNLLEAETWLTAKESLDLGLADEIGTPLNVAAALIKEGRYAKTPQRFLTSELPRDKQRSAKVAIARHRIALDRKQLGV